MHHRHYDCFCIHMCTVSKGMTNEEKKQYVYKENFLSDHRCKGMNIAA